MSSTDDVASPWHQDKELQPRTGSLITGARTSLKKYWAQNSPRLIKSSWGSVKVMKIFLLSLLISEPKIFQSCSTYLNKYMHWSSSTFLKSSWRCRLVKVKHSARTFKHKPRPSSPSLQARAQAHSSSSCYPREIESVRSQINTINPSSQEVFFWQCLNFSFSCRRHYFLTMTFLEIIRLNFY